MAMARVQVQAASLLFLVHVDVTLNWRLSISDPKILWTENCDWDFTKSTNVRLPLGPTPRWTEFQDSPDNRGLNLNEHFASALSFSVRTDDNGSVTLDLYSEDFKRTTKHTFTTKKKQKLGDSRYEHFTLWKRNNKFWDILSEERNSSINVSSIFPQRMFVNNHWKIHDYNFVSSQKESVNENVITVENYDSEDIICISFLHALNNNSILELELKTSQQTKKVGLVGKDSALINWQRDSIQAESKKFGNLKINRKLKEGATGPGFWALDDIQFCNPGVDKNQVIYKPCPNQRKHQTIEENIQRDQKDQNDPEDDNNTRNVNCTKRYSIRWTYVTNFKQSICACDLKHLTLFIKTENRGIERIKFNEVQNLSYNIKLVDNKIVLNPLEDLTTGIWIVGDEEHTFSQLCDTDGRACENQCSSTEAPTTDKTTQEATHYVLWGVLVFIVLLLLLLVVIIIAPFKLRSDNTGNEGAEGSANATKPNTSRSVNCSRIS